MPRIPDGLLDCVVYLYPSPEDAAQGRRVGGTGFLLSMRATNTPSSPHNIYVVTNSHVAVNAGALRVNTSDGGSDVVPVESGNWTHHPAGDDVAIMPIRLPSAQFRIGALDYDTLMLSKDGMLSQNIGVGDEVFFIGRFIAHDGRQKNMPVVRFGNIAMMPGEPVYQKERAFHQESFLVEARSLSGFSGSPVFIFIPPFSLRFQGGVWKWNDGGLSPATTLGLLGMDWGTMHLGDEALTNSGVMAVVPAWKIDELLTSDEVVQSVQDER